MLYRTQVGGILYRTQIDDTLYRTQVDGVLNLLNFGVLDGTFKN